MVDGETERFMRRTAARISLNVGETLIIFIQSKDINLVGGFFYLRTISDVDSGGAGNALYTACHVCAQT